MRRLSISLLLVAGLALAAAGCGGDDGETTAPGGTATFENPEFDITFDYPAEFQTLDDISFNRQAGSSAGATAGVGLDSANLLAVQRFDLNTAVTDKNLKDVQPEADQLFSQLAGEDVEGEQTDIGGLPALEYEIALTEPPDGETRAVAIFDGQTQYLLNCQSTPPQRAAVEEACDQALDTLETTTE